MYAAGSPSPQKEACIAFLQKIQKKEIHEAISSAEVLQEILHRYHAIQRLKEGLEVYDLFRGLPILWLEVTPHDADAAAVLLKTHTSLSSRDALHAAVMKRKKINHIITYDQGFKAIPDMIVCLPDDPSFFNL